MGRPYDKMYEGKPYFKVEEYNPNTATEKLRTLETPHLNKLGPSDSRGQISALRE